MMDGTITCYASWHLKGCRCEQDDTAHNGEVDDTDHTAETRHEEKENDRP